MSNSNYSPQSLEEFALLLKKQIKASSFTIKQVFEEAGIPPVYLSRWKNGSLNPPSYIQVANLAKILGIPIDILIYGKVESLYIKIPINQYREKIDTLEMFVESEKELLNSKTYLV
jgi:transcriptional regulator with XRE-family HTH domain